MYIYIYIGYQFFDLNQCCNFFRDIGMKSELDTGAKQRSWVFSSGAVKFVPMLTVSAAVPETAHTADGMADVQHVSAVPATE